LIDPRYLSQKSDMQVLREGVKLARRLFQTDAFSAAFGGVDLPAATVTTDAQMDEDIRQRAESIYHPVGTCRMGEDELAVVDSHLRVKGVSGLRVADASVMPLLISGNTNAPSMMIGERAAGFMLGENS
jgi:choline dehydrogenase-like flavoprotein